jgi:Zn-dependent protease with chaperone function
MNFFDRQVAARRASSRLVLLCVLAVAGIVLAVDFVAWLPIAAKDTASPGETLGLLALVSLLVLAIIGLGSLHRIATLSGGGEAIARQLGGMPVHEQSRDPQLQRLRQVVEAVAIASGVPMPKLYVLEQESGINACVAGYAPADAAIAVTRGALERLDRDELRGVIAHGFSHVLNGDMRVNLRLVGMLSGILVPALAGRRILEHGRSAGRGWSAHAVLGAAFVAMGVGAPGLVLARMIKAGVSRSRTLLADASAVQSTRQTAGLAGALKKIAGLPGGATLAQRGEAEEVGHLLFADGVGLQGLFATHPPPLQRIRALEPTFDATQLSALQRRWAAEPPDGLAEDIRLGAVARNGALPAPDAVFAMRPAMVVAQVAQPAADDFRRADAIVAALPAAVRALAADRDSVVPLVIGLLLDADPAVRARQHTEIAARLGRQAAVHAQALRDEHLDALHSMLRLPLVALAFPMLGQRPRTAIGLVLDTVHAAVNTDGRVSVFEYCLGTLLQAQMREALDPVRHAPFGRRRLVDARDAVALLLATIAQAGHDSDPDARRAWLVGFQRVFPQDHVDYAPPANGVLALDPVWPQLDALAPEGKQALVEAMAAVVGRDGRITVVNAETLRTLCALLHCPLPPVLERA